jgi:aminodeoxyfutalosine synthase
MNPEILRETISSTRIKEPLKAIAEKVLKGERITPGEGLILFHEGELGLLGMLAGYIRFMKNGKNAYYIRNFHIEPTNICVNKCRFCSFSHHFSKDQWELTLDEILGKVLEQGRDVREVHITGAVHPGRDIYYYGEILTKIREIRSDLHIKAYSAVELDYMIRRAGMTFAEGLSYLIACGLNSIPGGGAEIFDEKIRGEICGMKSSSEDWLLIHETAHKLGLTSNATMLYGHLETYEHRIKHLERLRMLQDRTHGFNAFIPLKFKNRNHELGNIPEVSITEDMKNFAVSRIFLDNFVHIKAYWPAIGKTNASLALEFGVDDMDGTINDSTRIYSLAGAEEQNPVMTTSEMADLIRNSKRTPVERDSLYNPV